MKAIRFLFFIVFLFGSIQLSAHEVRPAFLQLKEIQANTFEVLFKIPGKGPNQRLSLYVIFPEDVKVIAKPKSSYTGDAFLERMTFSKDGGLTGSEIRIKGLEKTLTDVLVRIEYLSGHTDIISLKPGSPSFIVKDAPDKIDVATTYGLLGIEHILGGIDHLLFVLGLFLIVSNISVLIKTITGFTVSHSITLILAALGVVHVPQAPVEAIIALSIVFLAYEYFNLQNGRATITSKQPWVVAFIFGLLHGLGFAGALSEIGLPTIEVPLALLTFNVGVEIGQLIFLGILLLIAMLGRRIGADKVAFVPKYVAYSIGSVAMFWLIERVSLFFS